MLFGHRTREPGRNCLVELVFDALGRMGTFRWQKLDSRQEGGVNQGGLCGKPGSQVLLALAAVWGHS